MTAAPRLVGPDEAVPPPDHPPDETPAGHRRKLTLTAASGVRLRAVRWLWDGRLPLGSLALLGGREGIGKSTAAYTLAADLTRGQLDGHHKGNPRAVVVCATEDSWGHTIAPRLLAAGADLDQVFRVDVTTSEGIAGGLSLPADVTALEREIRAVGAALLLLDPLMSRLDAALDTHKDSEVRQALEPLTALADRTGATVLGLIHVNKGRTSDPLSSLMGSRAFAAVARSVLYVIADQDDPGLRLLGLAKNNLGRGDLPTLRFRIESAHVADTPEGAVWTGRLTWSGEDPRSLAAVLEDSHDTSDNRTATTDAGAWLLGYLADNGGTAPSADIKTAGAKNGHSYDALKRARTRNGIQSTNVGFPRSTYWSLPGTQTGDTP
ncbi:AAA family ATPase [Blastococcus saxobsidens]|uniref:AAA domain-containing protein n=1 Tax=Blastococcus saxobsidens TaxID=138336 RepID=A0A4Q7Y1U5_9ACTN|nr:AAA family ATPase [Blastococcus saxobsidens]RZU30468.1 AAA domain-containing protein [Blastococcus saxobsidens]